MILKTLVTGVILTMTTSVIAQTGSLSLGAPEEMVKLPEKARQNFKHKEISFQKIPGGVTWVSDIEHVIPKDHTKAFLADTTPAYYMAGDTVPGNQMFELFPYHYYGIEEERELGTKISYKLICKNPTNKPVKVEIYGLGTTTNWDHGVPWELALKGNGKTSFTLKPGEIYTLWEEKYLRGNFPWSGIVLGKADGDLWVADYAWQGEKDPGIENATNMPDLAWPPYKIASFSRGIVNWNTAELSVFQKNHGDVVDLAKVKNKIYSTAFGYSPGGPIDALCEYKIMDNSSPEDVVEVKDPLSGKSHIFFGGNYPIMYKFNMPITNSGRKTRVLNFYLSANDIYNVDTLSGVFIEGKLLKNRVLSWNKNQNWRVLTVTLKPGESYSLSFTVIPLGSRWGGMVGCFEVK